MPEGNVREVERAIRTLLDQPFGSQLGILRTVGPRILAQLTAQERASFLRDLLSETEQVARGGPPYDLRPSEPSHR